MPVGETKYGVVADAIESSQYVHRYQPCTPSALAIIPFSGWPVVGSQLRILSPFQDRCDERLGTGTP